jgi:hypothetical protein
MDSKLLVTVETKQSSPRRDLSYSPFIQFFQLLLELQDPSGEVRGTPIRI